jgi:hypothetical protein
MPVKTLQTGQVVDVGLRVRRSLARLTMEITTNGATPGSNEGRPPHVPTRKQVMAEIQHASGNHDPG